MHVPHSCLIQVTFLADPATRNLAEECPVKAIAQNTQGLRVLVAVNIDRLLVPLLIVAALTLAGWLISYATVH